jgi:peptidoglycan/LPS O-acetylase OafA/YrhL
MSNKMNPWLDLCRSIAILLVVFSHGRIFLTPVIPQAQTFKFGGFLGVELFFVLSGFLIGRILIDKTRNATTPMGWITQFWARRWLRTYPSYILFLIINLLLLNNIRPDIFPQLIRYITFTQSLLTPHPSFFGEAWSLAIEEIFYFLTPILLGVLLKITGNFNKSLGLTLFILFIIPLSLRFNAVITTNMTFNEIRSTALFRVDSIMFGVLAAWAYHESMQLRNILMKSCSIGILLLPLAIYIAAQPDSVMDGNNFLKIFFFNIANIGCISLIILGMNLPINKLVIYFSSRIARWSYAAYLTNLPILFLIHHLFPQPAGFISHLVIWLTFILCVFLSAFIVYTFFERQALTYRDRMFNR